jgi:hypothetical protein
MKNILRIGKNGLSGLVVLLGLLTACGAEHSVNSSVDSASVERPVFFVLGGNRSCKPTPHNQNPNPEGMDLYRPLQNLLEKISGQTRAIPEFFIACYSPDGGSMSYVSSWNPNIAYDRSETEVRQEILGKRASMGRQSAFLVGHSYGGWLAMSILSEAGTHSKFAGIFTIDPISKVRCRITRPFGCQAAPGDIYSALRFRIAQRSGQWHNFYQTLTPYLRSDAISQATRNYLIPASHHEIGVNPVVWNVIFRTSMRIL